MTRRSLVTARGRSGARRLRNPRARPGAAEAGGRPKPEAVKASDERPADRGGMPGSTVRVSS